MLIVRRRTWFKVVAAATAASTTWLGVAGTAYAAPARALRRSADDVAAQLHVEPGSISGLNPAEEVRRVAERRAKALERLEQWTRGHGTAAVAKAASEIRRVHRPSLLGGLTNTIEEARSIAANARSGDAAAQRIAATRLAHVAAAVEYGARRAESVGAVDARLSAALGNARKLAQAARNAAKGGRNAGAAEVERLAPKRQASLDTRNRVPMQLQHVAPPKPRTGVRLGAIPTMEQRELYASFLDAPGLRVETEIGPADATLLAAGFAPEPMLAAGSLSGGLDELLDLAAGALPGPAPADLGEGPETRATAEIRAQVEKLGRDPIAIFNLVHDGFDAEPYYGAKKGSVGAWTERAGNDADLASLLVAMLRAAGVPARFEYGTVDLTPEQALAWTGTTDVYQAADALATGGIPTSVVERPGERVVRVEHVWVRAWVPYSNYRGVPRAGSRSTWVRLDPTLQRARVRPAADLRGKVAFDYAAFLAQVGPQTPLATYEAQLLAYAQANGIPCKTLDDFIPARERIGDALTLLPAELPARIQSVLATFAGLPASLVHSAVIGLAGPQATLTLPELYGAALTLRYRGATSADQAAIAAAGGIARLAQPSSVRVVPTLVVDGVERLAGRATLAGARQEITAQIQSPHDAVGLVRHQIVAGGVFALGFPVGKIPDAVVESRELEYSRAVLAGATGDDLEAARGNRALWRYFWHLGRDWERLLGLNWARVGFAVSEGIAGRALASTTLYGVPVSVRPGNFVIDVPRLAAGPYSVDGQQKQRLPEVLELAGYQGSTWEHLIWEDAVHAPSLSTVRVFQVAREQGQTLQTLTAADAALVPTLPFSDDAKQDIGDALHRGLAVTVPQRPVTWIPPASASIPSPKPYSNVEGYVLKDPKTGAADFRISGLYSGGESNGEGSAGGTPCPTCSGPVGSGGSSVSMSDGAMFFPETDLVVPARGIPVTFVRRYNSASPYRGSLGQGWQHTYEVHLVPESDGVVTYVNDEQHAERFAVAADGTFTAPAGYTETLSAVTGGYELTFKDGVTYRFGADGRLTAIRDPNGHEVRLSYTGGLLSSVADAQGRTALSFEYDSNRQLSAVRDVANRAVQFGHDGNQDLVSVTDVLSHVQQYAYDSAHRMTSKTDRNGNVVQEFYDGDGRWIAAFDPLGNGRSVAYDMLNRRAVHEDKTGAQTIYEYNERGNPVAITDALGNRREMGWDGAYHKLWERDARGNETTYTYDPAGNLETRTDAAGVLTRYTYDGSGRVLTVTTSGKLVAQNTYDARGNLETSTDANLKVTQYGYTSDGLVQTITQPGSATTQLAYNPDGTVKAVTDGENGTTSLGYDGYGHLSTITDPLQNVRTLVPDASGRIQSMIDASQRTTTFEYDSEGNRTAVIDAEQHRTSFAYDAVNRLSVVTDAGGGVSRIEYDGEGRVTERRDPLQRKTSYRYDATGRLVETTDGNGNTTTQGFCADVSTQACAIVDPLGNYTQVEFDALGRPESTTDANGTVTSQHYDAFGRRDRAAIAGHETSYEYDDAGRLKKVTNALQGVTEYGYDDRGNRTSVKDANGAITSFGYDHANRLVWERNPIQAVGQETRYEYDAAGNRRFKTDGNGRRTEYVYDANRRLKAVLFADGSRYDFDYDARGNRTLEKSPTHERGLSYDALGRLERVEDRTLGRVIQYAYDAAGQRSGMTLDSGESVEYRWDNAGRLFETTDPQGQTTRFGYDAAGRRTSATYGNGTRATYAYDAAGQVLSIAYLDGTGAVQTAFGYGYDATGNRTRKTFADGTEEAYGYDALSRLTSASYADGRQVTYAYDAVGNRTALLDSAKAPLARWAASATASSTYPGSSPANATGAPDTTGCAGVNTNNWIGSWDSTQSGVPEWLELTYANAERASGVRIHETRRAPFVTKVEVVEEDGTAHTVFEGADGTACGDWLTVRFPLTAYAVKKVKVYTQKPEYEGIDAVGLEVAGGETYSYNGFNQLGAVTPRDGSTATTFGYDANGNQTSKTDGTGTTTYVYNDDNRLVGISLPGGGSNAFEYDANGLRTRKTDSAGTTRYLLDGLSVIAQYAPDGQRQAWYTQSLARIDEVLNVANDAGKFWYQADALGSVYALTNQAGALIGSQNYDVFGAPMPAPSGPAGQPFGFTGREHELDSGLVYARARYLNPAVGRWDRPDPLGMIDGPARYVYAENSPDLYRDPTGLFKADIHVFATTPAFAGIITGWEYPLLISEAAYTADGAAYQLDSRRHGMRDQGVSFADGVTAWVDFVDEELVLGVVWGQSTCAQTHEQGLRELAYGVHAAEDYFSPPHRMSVMNWWPPSEVQAHSDADRAVRPESGPARQALEVAGIYAQVYRLMRSFPAADRTALRGLAWGFMGRFLSIEAQTQE